MFYPVAVSGPVLLPKVLVLAGVVFVGLHDPHARHAGFVERTVMTAAAEPVEAIDHHDVKVRNVRVGHAVDITGEIARRAVDFAAGETADAGFFFGLDRARALGKNAGGGVVDDAVDAFDVADHVVVEYRLHAPAAI